MNLDAESARKLRALLIAVAVIALMWVAAEVLQPIALAVLFAFILDPLVRWLERRGLPRVVGVTIVMVLTLVTVGGLGYVAVRQVSSLAEKLPEYQKNIDDKIEAFRPGRDSTLKKVTEAADHVRERLEGQDQEAEEAKIPEVRVVQESNPFDNFGLILGPFQSFAGLMGLVLLLLFFLLLDKEDVQDRLVRLAGHGRIALTAKTMNLVGKRVSSYLTTFSAFGAAYGLVVGLSLWLIGLPYAALWGVMAALLRFIPYLGPLIGITMPTLFAIAFFPDWLHPLMVLGMFGVAELVSNALEPYIYGKSVGVSSLGLLVTAMFWTWIWGPLGLLISTPLTVLMAVLGKYVPSLGFMHTLIGDEVEVDEELLWYQKVLHRDQDGAVEILEAALKERPLEEVFDAILIPALSRADQDVVDEVLDRREAGFIWSVVAEWLDDLSARESTGPPPGEAATSEESWDVVGVATSDQSDVLILRMLDLLLRPTEVRMKIVEAEGATLAVSDQIAGLSPDLILVSHLPPMGLTRVRYLISRLRARLKSTPMVVGWWDADADPAEINQKFQTISDCRAALSLTAARDMIVRQARPHDENAVVTPTPTPAAAAAAV